MFTAVVVLALIVGVVLGSIVMYVSGIPSRGDVGITGMPGPPGPMGAMGPTAPPGRLETALSDEETDRLIRLAQQQQ